MVQNASVHLVFDHPKSARHSAAPWPPLATHGRPNQIQVSNANANYTNASLQSDVWVCTHLLELNHTGFFSHRVPPRNVIWHCQPYTQGNLPDCSHVWFLDGGTSYQMLSEQGHPSLSLRISWRLICTKSTSFPNTCNTLTCLTRTYCALIYLISLHFVILSRFST